MKFQPNPKLTPETLLEKIDRECEGRSWLFIEMLEKDCDIQCIRKMLSVNNKRWAWVTVKGWAELYNSKNAKP